MTSVRLGVHLPVAGQDASPQAIAQVAQEAERIGLRRSADVRRERPG